jgi:hypothetical protein
MADSGRWWAWTSHVWRAELCAMTPR